MSPSTPTFSFPGDVPRLTDGVVTLRAHTEDDVQALYEQAVDSVMLQWTTVPDPSTPETAKEFACDIIPTGWRRDSEWAFAVEAPGEDGSMRFVGSVSLRNEGEGRAEVAYGAHPWARGRGYVVRALELLLDWGFRERGLRTVIWWADKGNWASRKVAWRLGFSFDGTVRAWLPHRGELRDGWVGVLTSSDERRPRTPWFEVPTLTGRSVVLRGYRDTDAPRVVEACSDERSARWLPLLPSPYTLHDAHEYIEARREQRATGHGVTWAVADPETDELLANITIFDLGFGKDAEIGYWAHPAARGRGVMTEACGLVVRHAFVPEEDGGMGLRRLRIIAAEGNVASRKVIEANGFVETGRMRQENPMRDGSYADTIYYDLLASEYSRG
ncbi:MAG TPA: GNAT family N-acetyltransferase [Nocardioidaceae bacterium]|nr:GNAT family N-acetyltransferase [Nocardioidaceae bacterium]